MFVHNGMVSESKLMMAEPGKLEVLMRLRGVRLNARWIPSAVNKFADSMSRTWDLGEMRATGLLSRSVLEEYCLYLMEFQNRTLGETFVARCKHI